MHTLNMYLPLFARFQTWGYPCILRSLTSTRTDRHKTFTCMRKLTKNLMQRYIRKLSNGLSMLPRMASGYMGQPIPLRLERWRWCHHVSCISKMCINIASPGRDACQTLGLNQSRYEKSGQCMCVCDEHVTQVTVDIKTVAPDNAYKILASHVLFLQEVISLLSHSNSDYL